MQIDSTLTDPGIQSPPLVEALQSLFARLDDSQLLAALQGPTRRGPKGYSVRTLWRCFLTKHHMGLPSTAALIRTLRDNPFVARACGIGSPENIPDEATFSRFFAKLTRRHNLTLLKEVSRSLVRQHHKELPGFGDRVAVDATTLKAWSNGARSRKADKEAGWSIKSGPQGTKQSVYGYKLHLVADCEHELPIGINISPGNVHDSQRASHALRDARRSYQGFHPRYVMADAAYSGKDFMELVQRQYGSTPVVKLNRTHRGLIAKDAGFETTPEYKALYKQRQSVERVFSRLKGQRYLNHITVRGRRKVTVHVYMALIVMQALAGKGGLQ